jgi:hypothetical protein
MCRRLQVDLPRALLQSDLEDPISGTSGLHDDRRLFAQAAHGLLRVDILAGVHGIYGVVLVPGIGRPDQDRVDFRQFQELTMVPEGFGVRRGGERLRELGRIDVAERAYLDVGVLLEQPLHIGTASPGADHTQTNPVVGAQNPGIRESRQGGAASRVASRRVIIGLPPFEISRYRYPKPWQLYAHRARPASTALLCYCPLGGGPAITNARVAAGDHGGGCRGALAQPVVVTAGKSSSSSF